MAVVFFRRERRRARTWRRSRPWGQCRRRSRRPGRCRRRRRSRRPGRCRRRCRSRRPSRCRRSSDCRLRSVSVADCDRDRVQHIAVVDIDEFHGARTRIASVKSMALGFLCRHFWRECGTKAGQVDNTVAVQTYGTTVLESGVRTWWRNIRCHLGSAPYIDRGRRGDEIP